MKKKSVVLDNAITTYLRENNMTQRQMAEKLGMSENTLSWKRRGVNDWNLSEAVAVCNITGCDLHAVQEEECWTQ